MIRNVLVLSKEGKGLFVGDFTGSDELSEGTQMMNAIISAVHSFSKMLSAEGASEIRLGDLTVHFASRRESSVCPSGRRRIHLILSSKIDSYFRSLLRNLRTPSHRYRGHS